MSTEAMKLALAALETCRIRSVSEWSVEDITPKNVTAAIAALRTAIQQAEAQQPATGEQEADGLPPIVAGAVFDFAGFMTTRSEVIEVGSTADAGPVADLVKEWAESRGLDLADAAVLSWQLHITRASLPATDEPVLDVRCEGCGYMTHHREHMGCVRAAKQHTHPAPSVPADVAREAERGRFLVGWLKRFGLLQAEFGQIGAGEKSENWWLLHAPWGIDKTRPSFGHGKTPEQAIDDAMIAAK